jgi:hypothetical protein
MKLFATMLALFLADLAIETRAQDTHDQAEAMKALGMLFGGGGATNAVIHHSQLKALLPTEFSGMKRSNLEAGKQAAMGMNISYAEADYSDDNERNLSAKITDLSAMAEFMRMAQYGWAGSEMERETETGYEKTTKIDGFPAQESYENEYKSGSLQVMVDGRFIIEVSGSGVTMDEIKDLVNTLGPKNLVDLKPAPAN